jgi:ribose 5-phosphate isomerase B
VGSQHHFLNRSADSEKQMVQFEGIRVGYDHAGFPLVAPLTSVLADVFSAHQIQVWGPESANISVDYPFYAQKVASWVQNNAQGCGLLICGSGVGMSIAANRFSGVRAALCGDVAVAKLSRAHNDANVLVLGARITAEQVAKECLISFLHTVFQKGRHESRLVQIENCLF